MTRKTTPMTKTMDITVKDNGLTAVAEQDNGLLVSLQKTEAEVVTVNFELS